MVPLSYDIVLNISQRLTNDKSKDMIFGLNSPGYLENKILFGLKYFIT